MEKAKNNLESFFYTFGILEQWDDTLALLESMLPTVYSAFKNCCPLPQVGRFLD